MDESSEQAALQTVQARLLERFPYLGEDVVAAVIAIAHAELTGPIRDFVPILVEHTARTRLAAMTNCSDPHARRAPSPGPRALIP